MSTIKVDTYLTRGGASEIAIDKLKGVSSASSISVVAEGGTNTTNLQQGLAKSFINFELVGTAAVRDSFNHASFTDNATGDASVTITTAMGNINFAHVGMGGHDATSLIAVCQQRNAHAPSTTVSRYQLAFADGSLHDSFYAGLALVGDLA